MEVRGIPSFNNNLEVAEYVNSLGGRERAIVVLEVCESCGTEFFSTVMDNRMRESNGTTVLCPKCRVADIRAKKREAERERRKHKKQ